jgi:hypothetical protein
MARDALAWRNPVDQVMTPFSDQNRTTGRGLLRRYGAIGDQDTWGNYAGGMAAEMVLDPTNLVGAGLLGKYAKAASGVGKANKAIDAGNALSLQQRAMGFMPEEIAKQTKIATEAGPTTMYHGTGHAFDQYDASKLSDEALYGRGIYTTANPEIASEYASKGVGTKFNRLGTDAEVASVVRSLPFHSGLAYRPEMTDADLAKRVDNYLAEYGRQKHLTDRGDLPDRLPPVAKPFEELYDVAPPPMNVRQQFLDIRNPLDIDAHYTESTGLPRGLADKKRKEIRGNIRLKTSIARVHKDILNEPSSPMHVERSTKRLNDLNEEIRESLKLRQDPVMTGKEIYENSVTPQGYGFDGIVHVGGDRMGTVPHNVAIAFDPSQVYKPYIAPALQNQLPLPAPPTRTLRALGAANLARGGRKQ